MLLSTTNTGQSGHMLKIVRLLYLDYLPNQIYDLGTLAEMAALIM